MKKILSLVLVLVLALGSFSFATPADVVGTDYASAVDRLMNLNLLTGYPDGTFKPAATITRAEFAAVVVRSLGLETAAIKGATKFADVPATHWASGYISVASGLGVINGYTTGNFGPNDAVTYEQAVAMVVRALGYEPAVASKGGYPAGYLIVASENDLLDGVVGTVGAPAPRGLVAMLVDNAVETPLMIQIGYGSEVKYVISGTDGTTEQTLLGDKLGLDTATKTVASVDTDDNTIKFVGDAVTYKAAPGIKFDKNLVNLELTVWTKSKTVYVMTVESTVMFDYVDNADDDVADEKTVTLLNADKTYSLKALANGNVDATVVEDGTSAAIPAAGIADDDYDGFYGKFIFNDENEVTHMEVVSTIPSIGIISEITDLKVKYTNVLSNTGAAVTLVDMDDADFGFVAVDGKLATYADLKAGMFMEYGFVNDMYFIVASSAKIEGKLDSVAGNRAAITIAGTKYDLNTTARYSADKMDNFATLANATDLNDHQGTVITAYKNAKQDVYVISGDVKETTTTFYGIVKLAATFTEQLKVQKIVDGDIELVTYKYDSDEIDPTAIGGQDYTTNYGGGLTAADVKEIVVDEDNVIIEINAVATTNVEMASVNDTANSFVGGATTYFPATDATIFDITDLADVAVLTWAEVKASDIVTASTVMVSIPTGDSTPDLLVVTDNDGVLGTSTEDYILAYAPSAPVLSAGKYTATVKTMTGDLAVVIDDAVAKINGWNDSKAVLVLQKQANGEYVVKNVEHGNDFVVTGALASIDDNYTDVAVVDPYNVGAVDGQFITLNGVVYKVADNALVYRVYDDGDTISASDVSAVVVNDDAIIVHEDGVIYFMMYER